MFTIKQIDGRDITIEGTKDGGLIVRYLSALGTMQKVVLSADDIAPPKPTKEELEHGVVLILEEYVNNNVGWIEVYKRIKEWQVAS